MSPPRFVLGTFQIPIDIYEGLPRKGGIYMGRYLLKASDEDFDRWRRAAKHLGYPSLASFLRASADARALPGLDMPPKSERLSGSSGGRVVPVVQRVEWRLPDAPVVERPFRPDFRGGKP